MPTWQHNSLMSPKNPKAANSYRSSALLEIPAIVFSFFKERVVVWQLVAIVILLMFGGDITSWRDLTVVSGGYPVRVKKHKFWWYFFSEYTIIRRPRRYVAVHTRNAHHMVDTNSKKAARFILEKVTEWEKPWQAQYAIYHDKSSSERLFFAAAQSGLVTFIQRVRPSLCRFGTICRAPSINKTTQCKQSGFYGASTMAMLTNAMVPCEAQEVHRRQTNSRVASLPYVHTQWCDGSNSNTSLNPFLVRRKSQSFIDIFHTTMMRSKRKLAPSLPWKLQLECGGRAQVTAPWSRWCMESSAQVTAPWSRWCMESSEFRFEVSSSSHVADQLKCRRAIEMSQTKLSKCRRPNEMSQT